jgi:hypothetical protein
MIQNLQAFHAAIAAVAPIYGVSADGTTICFAPTATPAQIAAAHAAASAYVETPAIIAAAGPQFNMVLQTLPKPKNITDL